MTLSGDSGKFLRDCRDPPDCGKKRESNHFVEVLENLEIVHLKILEIPPVKRPFSK